MEGSVRAHPALAGGLRLVGDDRSLRLIKGAGPPDLDEVGPVQKLDPDPEGRQNRVAVSRHPAAGGSDRQTHQDVLPRPQAQPAQPSSRPILTPTSRPHLPPPPL